jgi:hypothetical protein
MFMIEPGEKIGVPGASPASFAFNLEGVDEL